MGVIRRGRSQREEIKRITDEYLESIQYKLTPRDYKILETLLQFGIMTSRHLYELTPGAGSLSAFNAICKGQQRLNDRLRALFDLNLVYKMSPLLAPGEGTSVQYVWLDRGGLKLLGVEKESRRTLPADHVHRACLLDVYCYFRRSPTEIHYLEIEPVQRSVSLIPDVIVLYRLNSHGYLYFIEVDRGEKKERDEIAKIEAYRNWQLSAGWLAEPWARILPQPRFPYLIYLFDSHKTSWKRRQKLFQQAASSVGLPFRSMTLEEFRIHFVDTPYTPRIQ